MQYQSIQVIFTKVTASELPKLEKKFCPNKERPRRSLVVKQIDGGNDLMFDVQLTFEATALDTLDDAINFIKNFAD